jgi:hypothetical protein
MHAHMHAHTHRGFLNTQDFCSVQENEAIKRTFTQGPKNYSFPHQYLPESSLSSPTHQFLLCGHRED